MSLAPGCGILILLKARILLRQWAKGQHLLWQAGQAEDRPPIDLDSQAHDAVLALTEPGDDETRSTGHPMTEAPLASVRVRPPLAVGLLVVDRVLVAQRPQAVGQLGPVVRIRSQTR